MTLTNNEVAHVDALCKAYARSIPHSFILSKYTFFKHKVPYEAQEQADVILRNYDDDSERMFRAVQ